MVEPKLIAVKLPNNCTAHKAMEGEIVHIKETLCKLEKKFDKGLYLLLANLAGLVVILAIKMIK